MSDDDEQRAKKKSILHTPTVARQTPIATRLSSLERALQGLIQSLPEMISAGSLALGQKVYTQLAEQHARVFDTQEAAFMACLEQLHTRLAILESNAGIASPELQSFRDSIDAIADYLGAVAESDGRLPAWKDLDAADRRVVVETYRASRAEAAP